MRKAVYQSTITLELYSAGEMQCAISAVCRHFYVGLPEFVPDEQEWAVSVTSRKEVGLLHEHLWLQFLWSCRVLVPTQVLV